MPKALEIIYQDEHIVAINKPHGLLVHRTSLASRETVFALQLLRNQIKQRVYPLHRLDRKTSGVLLFALDSNTTKLLQKEFISHLVVKKYLAIVRGYFPKELHLDYPLTNSKNKTQEAITDFKLITKAEINIPFGQHSTSRYSLIEAFPKTGRMHQIRKHLKHLKHPIIGDRPHGCNKQNKFFLEQWNMITTLLHAQELQIVHPIKKVQLNLKAKPSDEFIRMRKQLAL